ncbi:hypothetical protein ACMXYV_11985 [Neptuniibacter sp. SY11_33]|uniref:hypothetical protein n=1 Tax=Neptuniibacter sp. SY11_33 TaxID=3398215 RepID=UPI0039F5A32C
MKISKIKGVVIAALIAMTFFSFQASSSFSLDTDFTVEERSSEVSAPDGSKEVYVSKNYKFKISKESDKNVVISKQAN